MENENVAEAELAGFQDRVVAFSADAALFYIGYLLSYRLAFPHAPVVSYPGVALWWAVWTALFLFYQAFLSAEGRVTLGKRLAGIRVAEPDGSALTLNEALLRTVVLPASAIAGLGFLWSLFNEQRQCWHDLVAGSVVVRTRPQTALVRGLATAGATACFLVLGLAGLWQNVWAERYEKIMTNAYSRVGLSEVVRLEQRYHEQTGSYADNLFDLAPLSGDPKSFLTDMANLFDLENFDIQVAPDGCTIKAQTRDDERDVLNVTIRPA